MNPSVIQQNQVASLLATRALDSHKGMFGTVTVIGGATGMTGAALLAGRAALRLGAGCVHVALMTDNAPAVDFVQPELMLHRASGLFIPSPHNVKSILNPTVLAAGCGMGSDSSAQKLLVKALHSRAALILDADALNLVAMHAELRRFLIARKTATLLTPHPGEAARLLACSTAEIQADRLTAVRKLADVFACSVVLKGAMSLCALRNGRIFVNRTGNPGMSAPGMGDVLTGMIAAFIAQGLSPDDALLLAVHLHGAAGDALSAQGITIGMTATELTTQARILMNKWVFES